MSADQQQQDPDYLLRETDREVERLRKQHRWLGACLKEKIVFAPVDLGDASLKVLDVGCILLRDLRKEIAPSAQLVGLDYMASFLHDSPDGNIRYVTGDACEKPAGDLVGAFGLTHVRFVLPGCGSVGADRVVANLAETLAPGGWLQIQEMDLSAGRTSDPSALNDVLDLFEAVFEGGGMGGRFSAKLGESLSKAGLENVTLRSVELRVGRRLAADEGLRRLSVEPFKMTIPTLVGTAKAMGADLPESVFDELEERFEEEMLETGGTFGAFIAYGQRAL
ncbi:methyltransferase [Colletotrichum sojae]|uniref:Methyltransferase n=1 Tax=Colletotrichum sojae TaxID=2175907 RepID=A0A8H6J4G8_9PEZI|nr:methyltransferase [Colletotrichum sojae]